ncbi:hypothetical protein [Ornithinibacillus gellani]|uniref:hypothetical protein n=1 Tax=Ornithinibacillus gellani TaxID=2293253 RepID=UPI0016813018|nr:hypothetical protein [Ornithinibacillus gellani]
MREHIKHSCSKQHQLLFGNQEGQFIEKQKLGEQHVISDEFGISVIDVPIWKKKTFKT